MVVLSRAFLHEHFLFFTCLSCHTTRTLSTSRTSPRSLSRQVAPSRSTLAWRPAERRKPAHNNSHRLRARTTCDRHEDQSLFWRSVSILWCTGKKKITELLSPKKWRNLENLGRLVCRIPNYQRRPTSNRRCISTIPWKALQILISKVESFEKMLTSPLYVQKASVKPDAMVMQERER